MAELDLARSVVAKEENDWVRSAEAVTQPQYKAAEEERNIGRSPRARSRSGSGWPSRRQELEAGVSAGETEREETPRSAGPAAPDPLRPAPQSRRRSVVCALRGDGVRRLLHRHPAQSSQPDPRRHA